VAASVGDDVIQQDDKLLSTAGMVIPY